MMATVAVTSLLPTYNAKADESHNDGAICTPTTEPLGDQTSGSGNDEGIATFVGGDMYVGGKKSALLLPITTMRLRVLTLLRPKA